MNEDALHALEYWRIVEAVAERTATPWGRELAVDLRPSSDLSAIERRQTRTAEAVVLVERGVVVSGAPPDIRPDLDRATRGGVIEPLRLLSIRHALDCADRLREKVLAREGSAPVLAGLARQIEGHESIRDMISRAISPDGEVADEASPELGRIRRQLRALGARVRERMEQLARSSSLRDVLQEPVVTIREDRFVLPVRQDRRTQIDGIIHDRSASGQTLFIEPLAVLGMNNALRRKGLEERAEVERILLQITAAIAAAADEIDQTLAAVARIDQSLAQGRLALDQRAIRPRVNGAGWIDIRRGRHPLLGSDAVPVDIALGRDYNVMVITGPNTGGKTVAMKTVGLFCLMAQAGLHVPADEPTDLCAFADIICDIGDEQSIDQSLSTFSSHMRNIVRVINAGGPDTLVLLDEIGVGTDPREGAALAMAVLEKLVVSGARAIATTHYDELKTFAFATPGMENAAVEFDPDTLAPTYRLIVGVPGSSWALAIASRLGMPPDVIDRARSFLDEGHVRVDALLRELEQRRRGLEHELTAAERARVDIERERDRLASERGRWEHAQRKTADETRADARRLIREYRERYGELLKDLDQRFVEAARRERDRLATEARDSLLETDRELNDELDRVAPEPVSEVTLTTLPPDRLRPGESVYVRSLRAEGELVGVDGDRLHATVQVGAVRARVLVSDLAQTSARSRRERGDTNIGTISLNKARTVPAEVMLRGLSVEDAEVLLDSYLDDASLAGHGEVRIIHGKGTGVLRQVVREALSRHPRVVGHRTGDLSEGGDGVTVAQLR